MGLEVSRKVGDNAYLRKRIGEAKIHKVFTKAEVSLEVDSAEQDHHVHDRRLNIK